MTGKQLDTAIAATYLPMIRGYFATLAIYYAAITVSNFMLVSGFQLWIYAGISSVTCLLICLSYMGLSSKADTRTITCQTMLVNALVLTNIIVAIYLEFVEAKLAYFIIATTLFALSSLSLRQAIIGCTAALGGLGWHIVANSSDQLVTYALVGLAAALSATGISHHLREAIAAAAKAEVAAQEARAKAEENLDHEKSAKLILKKESFSDTLTGLANRRAFFETFEAQVDDEAQGWIALLDLDGFKLVNDSYGHIMGDQLLKAVSFRLRAFCGDDALVSRIGGDEFALVFSRPMSEEGMHELAEKLLSRLAQTYPIDGRLIQISGSIGCCQINGEPSANAVMKNADFALLHAKRSGKNRAVSFNDEHAKAFAQHYKIEQALRTANFAEEIELVFQPQYDLRTNTIERAEALARWHSPVLGLVEPTTFIKVAEECGLMANISLSVVSKAIAQLQHWNNCVPVSVNLSAADLNSDDTTQAILDLLERHQTDASLIEFEVTETAMLVDLAKASANVRRLAARGHAIAIDDFGTGYSNFSNLRALPITKLKIDRSFVENLQDPMTEKILRSMVGLAQTLEVQCLLEGVEDELGMTVAKRTGMELVQGYLVGRPVSASELAEQINAGPAAHADRAYIAGSAKRA